MKDFRKIKKFYLVNADYFIGDAVGNEISLSVDYFNRRYRFEVINKVGARLGTLENNVKEIARNLLQIKSGVNFVSKLIK